MDKHTLQDEDGAFAVLCAPAPSAHCAMLFAVGGGGNPERHRPLLEAAEARGIAVIAPQVERMLSPRPTREALLQRARRAMLACEAVAPPRVPVVGVGHSIGAATLIALAGGHLWLDRSAPLPIAPYERLAGLALLAPATGFFGAPRALDRLALPIVAWAGSEDTMTAPAQAMFLREAAPPQIAVDVRVVQGADHFSFMHELPPHVPDVMPARAAFLAALDAAIVAFVEGSRSACGA